MTDGKKHQLYVAELKLPTCFYTNTEQRHEIPNPGGLEITKGYYIVRPPTEQSIKESHPEIVLVISFMNSNLKDAEDHAFKVGRLFSSLASAYGGYPFEEPYLHRVGIISADGRMKSQHNYLYGPKPYMLSAYDQTVGHQFQNYLNAVTSIDAKTKSQLRSAIHWYRMSISSDDPSVSYVAAWTGLESIGATIDKIAHTFGPKAQCQICGNVAGVKRDSKKAGITHMFSQLTCGAYSGSLQDNSKAALDEELLRGFSVEQANDLRDAIVHGLGDIEQLIKECSRAKRHLMHVLNASIQSLLEPSVKSWMTGDFEFHPIERVSLKCTELVSKSPFYDEWFHVPTFQTNSSVQEEGKLFTSKFAMEWELDKRLVESIGCEGFKRDTKIFSPEGSEIRNFPKWRDRPLEPPWKGVSELDGNI